MARLRAALLDVDGTLVESNDAHAQAWVEAFAEAKIDVSFDRIRSMIGMGGDRLLAQVNDLDENSEPGQTITKRREEIFKEQYLAQLRPTPGARELLDWLRQRDVRLIVATSAGEKESHALLKAAGLEDLIDVFCSKDDARLSKPAPDIFEAALEKSGFRSDESVMIGDTPYDCEPARRIGLAAVGLRCGGWDDAELSGAFIANDPQDLLMRWRESPLRRLEGPDSGVAHA